MHKKVKMEGAEGDERSKMKASEEGGEAEKKTKKSKASGEAASGLHATGPQIKKEKASDGAAKKVCR